jgi:hypothetical protein
MTPNPIIIPMISPRGSSPRGSKNSIMVRRPLAGMAPLLLTLLLALILNLHDADKNSSPSADCHFHFSVASLAHVALAHRLQFNLSRKFQMNSPRSNERHNNSLALSSRKKKSPRKKKSSPKPLLKSLSRSSSNDEFDPLLKPTSKFKLSSKLSSVRQSAHRQREAEPEPPVVRDIVGQSGRNNNNEKQLAARLPHPPPIVTKFGEHVHGNGPTKRNMLIGSTNRNMVHSKEKSDKLSREDKAARFKDVNLNLNGRLSDMVNKGQIKNQIKSDNKQIKSDRLSPEFLRRQHAARDKLKRNHFDQLECGLNELSNRSLRKIDSEENNNQSLRKANQIQGQITFKDQNLDGQDQHFLGGKMANMRIAHDGDNSVDNSVEHQNSNNISRISIDSLQQNRCKVLAKESSTVLDSEEDHINNPNSHINGPHFLQQHPSNNDQSQIHQSQIHPNGKLHPYQHLHQHLHPPPNSKKMKLRKKSNMNLQATLKQASLNQRRLIAETDGSKGKKLMRGFGELEEPGDLYTNPKCQVAGKQNEVKVASDAKRNPKVKKDEPKTDESVNVNHHVDVVVDNEYGNQSSQPHIQGNIQSNIQSNIFHPVNTEAVNHDLAVIKQLLSTGGGGQPGGESDHSEPLNQEIQLEVREFLRWYLQYQGGKSGGRYGPSGGNGSGNHNGDKGVNHNGNTRPERNYEDQNLQSSSSTPHRLRNQLQNQMQHQIERVQREHAIIPEQLRLSSEEVEQQVIQPKRPNRKQSSRKQIQPRQNNIAKSRRNSPQSSNNFASSPGASSGSGNLESAGNEEMIQIGGTSLLNNNVGNLVQIPSNSQGSQLDIIAPQVANDNREESKGEERRVRGQQHSRNIKRNISGDW